uniref:Putative lipocalin-3 1 n=1 Tax=Amblyomma triste TaxID=251400 RepID=A0A023GA99_AMBTT
METDDPLWTYKTTMGGITCKVDRKRNIIDGVITYYRSLYYAEEKIILEFKGTFSPNNTDDPDLMLYGTPGSYKFGYEVIIYSGGNYSCAVVNVTQVHSAAQFSKSWFDLRVTNSSIDVGPTPDCLEYYENVTTSYGKHPEVLYGPQCQEILK